MKSFLLKFSVIIIPVMVFVLSVSTASAAKLFFDVPTGVVTVGDKFPVDIRLDAEGQAINAAEVDFNYSVNIVRANNINLYHSIFVYRPVDPGFSNLVGAGSVVGGLPTPGFVGKSGLVAKVIMEAVKPGVMQLSFRPNSRVLLNDGLGTETHLSLVPNRLLVVAAPNGYKPNQPTGPLDAIPPLPFDVNIIRTPHAFNNQYFATFMAEDNESGIDHYEVIEVSGIDSVVQPEPTDLSWRVGESPHVMKLQHMPVTIFVKAVDRAGNIRIERGSFGSAPLRPNYGRIFALVLILFMLLCLAYFWGWFRDNRHKHVTHRPR